MARPLKFQSVEELSTKIQQFFDLIKDGEEEPSVVGLACHLETNKQTILNYQERDEFKDVIEAAKQQIEKLFTAKAYKGEVPPNIFIFTSKNHYEYKETQDVNLGGQKENPLIFDDKQRHTRIAELLNKCGTGGVIAAFGKGEAVSSEGEPS